MKEAFWFGSVFSIGISSCFPRAAILWSVSLPFPPNGAKSLQCKHGAVALTVYTQIFQSMAVLLFVSVLYKCNTESARAFFE